MLLANQIHRLQLNRLQSCHKLLNGASYSKSTRAFSLLSQPTVNTNSNAKSRTHLLPPTPLSQAVIRHYYQNYDWHPSKIVRAYRKTRNWFTEHFVIAERRFENAYSFTFLATFVFLFFFFFYLDFRGGAAGGLDDVQVEADEKKK